MNLKFVMRLLSLSLSLIFLVISSISGQENRWQQHAKYKMKIDFDVETHRYQGEQEIKYKNNSPDVLYKAFYHLYFNAFQPGSMMDVRSRTISDPDRRVTDRISKLSNEEIGYHKVFTLLQDGKPCQFEVVGTILEVRLAQPIQPGKTTTLKMTWESQVPVQIRRSGRNNAEGIDYSMAQWYPKLAEYDDQGWHANPYVGREFYGIWGDFEVDIKIDGAYTLGATGLLDNADKIGRGYSDKREDTKKKTITWKWRAKNVHDFVWAADRDYKVTSRLSESGAKLYFVYQPGEQTDDNWSKLPEVMDKALSFINDRYGVYPYPVYSFIQGGDGGMEYPMATLITGNRPIGSLVGVSVHELMHSWYQMVLGTNEALYAWMDEGFTSFATSETMNYLRVQKMIPGSPSDNPHLGSVNGVLRLHNGGLSEPLSTHADHFSTNRAYGTGSYNKGQVALVQLRYIMGEHNFYRGLKQYYDTWKFKHPKDIDFIRVMERASGLELDWFREYFVFTTEYPDYGVADVKDHGDKTEIVLNKYGKFPMPLDVVIEYEDGTTTFVNIPLRIMRGEKNIDNTSQQVIYAEDWPWTHPIYSFELPVPFSSIKSIEIDPSGNMLDLDRSNNTWSPSSEP